MIKAAMAAPRIKMVTISTPQFQPVTSSDSGVAPRRSRERQNNVNAALKRVWRTEKSNDFGDFGSMARPLASELMAQFFKPRLPAQDGECRDSSDIRRDPVGHISPTAVDRRFQLGKRP